MKTTKQNLIDELSDLMKKSNAISDKIEQIELKEEIPALEKKFKGRFFKTQNKYSRGRAWPLYRVVDEVTGINEYRGREFEFTSDGKVHMETKHWGYFSSLGKEITKSEYNKALRELKKKINTFFP